MKNLAESWKWKRAIVGTAAVISIGTVATMLTAGLAIPLLQITATCRAHTMEDKFRIAAREFRRRLRRFVFTEHLGSPENLLAEATKKFDPENLQKLIGDTEPYTYVTSGRCEDAGLSAISSEDECRQAAASLGFSAGEAKATRAKYVKKHPAGCIWNTRSKGDRLWFNPKSVREATSTIHMLCRQEAAEAQGSRGHRSQGSRGSHGTRGRLKKSLIEISEDQERPGTRRRTHRSRRHKGGEKRSAGRSKARTRGFSAAMDSSKPVSPPKPFHWACKHRMRKDWLDLDDAEKALYLEGVIKLKTTPYGDNRDAGPGNNIYDAIVKLHVDPSNTAYAHSAAGFLPWHRKYLLEYETAIRNVDPKFKCVTVPYWDWSSNTFECNQKGQQFAKDGSCETYHAASEFLRDLGGPGDASKRSGTFGHSVSTDGVGCVTTGPFKDWVDHQGNCLSRGVNWKTDDKIPFSGRIRLAEILQYKNYGRDGSEGFRTVIEGVPHANPHVFLGGHIATMVSPADPMFFSHHCYVDKIWAVWQDCHDYDTQEVTNLIQTKGNDKSLFKYYEPSGNYGPDNVDDPMVFNFVVTTGRDDPKKCSKTETACATCVHRIDPWCASNDWDQVCESVCTARPDCHAHCGKAKETTIDMLKKGQDVLQDWVYEETAPMHMHSVHSLGDRSYTYAPDEFERYLEKHEPAALGGCNLDSHANTQKKFSLLEEARRFHHADSPTGRAALEHAQMIQSAFNETRKTLARRLGQESGQKLQSQVFKSSMRVAQDKECQEIAMKCGDYQKEFNCKVNQPRLFVPWKGKAWKAAYDNVKLRKLIFQHPCCAGDDDALIPGRVTLYH